MSPSRNNHSLNDSLLRIASMMRYKWHSMLTHSKWTIKIAIQTVNILSMIVAIGTIIGVITYIGYEHNEVAENRILRCFTSILYFFVVKIFIALSLDFRNTIRDTRPIKWIVNALLIVALWPHIFFPSVNPGIPILQNVVYSTTFMISTVTAFALLELSYGLMRMLGRRTNPPLLLAGSFFIFILLGAFLLTMPRCTIEPLPIIDAIFVSTSAVCITGLTTVDIASTFTPFGQCVLALLIQIGGLGVLTFTSFFALFFTGGNSVFSQLIVKDMINSKSMGALIPTLLYILVFTLSVEAIGAVCVWFSIQDIFPSMDMSRQIMTSVFLSISSFCNAGFITLPDGMANIALLNSNQSIYIIVSLIVLAGSIGFPALVNFKEACHEYIQRLWYKVRHRQLIGRRVRLYNVNTKISIYTTLLLFIGSTLTFYILEYNNTLIGFSSTDKWIQSIFNATIPRSSGFQSVSPANFMPATLLIIMLLMWIGGASQSTAGGIKVNTIATLWLNLRSVVLGRDKTTVFNRTISGDSINRAAAVLLLSIICFTIYLTAMLLLQPELPTKAVTFETLSALFTVGSSLGITPLLSTASKLLLCSAMFIGRVGIISLLMGISGNHSSPNVKYPTDNIIIN